MHTIMKRNLVSYDLDITDPDMELEYFEGKTIGEAILLRTKRIQFSGIFNTNGILTQWSRNTK